MQSTIKLRYRILSQIKCPILWYTLLRLCTYTYMLLTYNSDVSVSITQYTELLLNSLLFYLDHALLQRLDQSQVISSTQVTDVIYRSKQF